MASSTCSDSQDLKLQNRVRYARFLWTSLIIGCGAIAVLAFVPDRVWCDWDVAVIGAKVKLFALCLACMGLAANLLTLNPIENRHKQIAYHVIAVAGFIAAFALFSPESPWVVSLCLWAISPVLVAYGRVFSGLFSSMYGGPKWLGSLSSGALLIPAGIAIPYIERLWTVPDLWRASIVALGLILAGSFLMLEKRYRIL